ncbi:MAG: glycoside hydrolase family 43 protein, partial [Lachnospiraceae bacterium]|nr:glycoside hydrolase family 43 protein [Lachnospiraceae bacterium]
LTAVLGLTAMLGLTGCAGGGGDTDDTPGTSQEENIQDANSGENSEGKEDGMTDSGTEKEFENHFEEASEALRADYEALTVRDADGVRGNLFLAVQGEKGSEIRWESSDPSVICAEPVENEGYDATPAGVVMRQEQDTEVTLYAYLTLDGVTLRREFEVKVLAKPEERTYTDYLFAYFVGNGVNQENIFFATSADGFSWRDANGGQPVLTTDLGTTGIRDPFLLRSAEGDRFFLIATDLCIAKSGDWWKAQTQGSRAVFIWESQNLTDWSEPRRVKINSNTAGCTWAPEAFYDEITGEYLVFWASRVSTDNYDKQRIYYVKTRDFYHFTEPKPWIDYPFSVIDTTVIRDGDTYYRFTKYEDKSRIIMERADRLLGEWTEVESETLSAQEGVEGPCCFALNEEDWIEGNRFCLLLDHFVGSGYYMMVTKDLSTAEFERKKGYSLPQKRPRHGTVILVTQQEYERIIEKYNK